MGVSRKPPPKSPCRSRSGSRPAETTEASADSGAGNGVYVRPFGRDGGFSTARRRVSGRQRDPGRRHALNLWVLGSSPRRSPTYRDSMERGSPRADARSRRLPRRPRQENGFALTLEQAGREPRTCGLRSSQGIRARAARPSSPRPPLTPHGSWRRRGRRRPRTRPGRWSRGARLAGFLPDARVRGVRHEVPAGQHEVLPHRAARRWAASRCAAWCRCTRTRRRSLRRDRGRPWEGTRRVRHVRSPSTRSSFCAGTQPDVRGLGDLIDEVLRHGVAQGVATHHDLHPFA